MHNYEKIFSCALLALGMIVTGLLLRNGLITFKDMDRTVTVKGLAEREVKANKVTWPLVYKELGNDPAEMYNRLAQKNNTVVKFLKTADLSDDDISINPPVITDRQADNYGNEIMNYRYKATSVITVTSTEVDKVRQLMRRQSDLMKQGIAIISGDYESTVVYEFTDLNQVKPEMVEEATRNARLTAQKFADDSGCQLGGIRSAQQGQFSIDNRDANTPYIKKIRVVNTLEYSLK